eukprot:359188-Chlamydomonas_euryale.AAC.14
MRVLLCLLHETLAWSHRCRKLDTRRQPDERPGDAAAAAACPRRRSHGAAMVRSTRLHRGTSDAGLGRGDSQYVSVARRRPA